MQKLGTRKTRHMTKLLSVLLILTMTPSLVFAQESDTAPSDDVAPAPQVQEQPRDYQPPAPSEMTQIYSPEHCEFKVGFPSAPMIKERCDGGESGTECYEQVNFTQTFGIDATVNIRVICNKIGQDIKDKYDRQIMVATLEAMTKEHVVDKFETTYYEDDDKRYRLAGLVGEGKVGLIPSIFVAQMWLGQKSAFSIEAEIVGDAFEEPDTLFRDIMRSVQYREQAAEPEKEKEAEPKPPETESSQP